ncbi:MAG: methylated-DNA--[protein]-cysteine S-methyltransferase [Bacteroidota bacterium]|nr:methylated-DNA--[protein]-cysteine S-methyltransferase [Bacteroidota bacterium]MDP4232908.1 methylated-DNA--[protein]-cysteine S-methyltransferase [Bacteroidota bacterium]MDP4241952.1 methylated-DNA--[protein]-cysteine S-methyltransferase [Bacteroidota bacterium]MDP4286855.1 methylated-DNA--[protein]-cysteine S-methyltransferase [Bacteroidota bacterium]
MIGTFNSPIGLIAIRADENGIRSMVFVEEDKSIEAYDPSPIVERCIAQLTEYFSGTRTKFDLPLAPDGTEFEKQVWEELERIPFGETCSYLDIAKRLDNAKAIRAVGRANGANPIAIIIPCHRVIGSDGRLAGYSGGLWRKRWLLDHEARIARTVLF